MAMAMLLAVIVYTVLRPHWPQLWPPTVEPIVIPPTALALGDAWPTHVGMCFWATEPMFCLESEPPTGRLH